MRTMKVRSPTAMWLRTFVQRWNAECDGRLRGRGSLSYVRVASAPSGDDYDDDDDALDHLTVVE